MSNNDVMESNLRETDFSLNNDVIYVTVAIWLSSSDCREQRKSIIERRYIKILYLCDNLGNMKQEMERLILMVCETIWINNEDFIRDDYRIIYTVEERKEKRIGLILDKY